MIQINNDRIDIYLNNILKPYYFANIEFVEAQLHKLKKDLNNRPVYIHAINSPLYLPLYRGILDTIADTLEVPPSQLIVITREHDLTHDKTTKMDLPIWGENYRNQVKHVLKGLTFSKQPNSKRFGALFGRIQWARIKLAHHLESNHKDKSYVVVQADKNQFDHFTVGVDHLFEDLKQWWTQRTNPVESCLADNNRGELNFPDNIKQWPQIWGLYDIEIIVETDYRSRGDWTEKTWKCLGSGKPFIIMNGANSQQTLRDIGFKTYAPYINESYDSIENYHDRLLAICQEIDRLSNLPEQEWIALCTNLDNIAQENREIFNTMSHAYSPVTF